MTKDEQVNILLVDDQPAKLLSYQVVLRDLGENLIQAASGTEALQILLKNEIAVVLIDVCMPDLDGFELAAMIRDHPRFQRTAIIFISAIHITETDYLRGYEMGAVDYVPVPMVPELLRAKVRVFAELYRKTRQLEKLNQELEQRVAERTSALEASSQRLRESERGRTLALEAAQMGSWDWNIADGECACDSGQYRIFGIEPQDGRMHIDGIRRLLAPDDFARLEQQVGIAHQQSFQSEVAVIRPNGETRACLCAVAVTRDDNGSAVRANVVMIDITERKQAEEKQLLLAREVDHRARNALAVVQAIVRLTRSPSKEGYIKAVEGRIQALAQAHTLLSESRWQGADIKRLVTEEIAPYRGSEPSRVQLNGPTISLSPERSQNLALVLHELATNSAKYGALSVPEGTLTISWSLEGGMLALRWIEAGGPTVTPPRSQGFGTKIMNASIKHQIGGHVAWDWQPTGLHCTLRIPIGTADQKNLVHLPSGATKRILLVEDDEVVGMMIRELLNEQGIFVIGPCSSLREALAEAAGEFEGAVLGLNLAGEFVYPVADILQERKIPFAFVVGNESETVDDRFADVPVLQTPITRESLNAQLGIMFGTDGPSRNSCDFAGDRAAPNLKRA